MSRAKEVIIEYLKSVQASRSPRTYATYSQGLRVFVQAVGLNAELTLDTFIQFLKFVAPMNPSSQAIHRVAVMNLYAFYATQGGVVNQIAMRAAVKTYAKKQGKRIVNFDEDALRQIICHAEELRGDLQSLRDRAFILTLADTGLRISEACGLRRGDIVNGKAVIIGKGDKEAVIRFSRRSLDAISLYLRGRAEMDGASGKPLNSLPLFARHDKGAGNKVKPVHSGGMWYAIKELAKKIGVEESRFRVHDFRHYFVTRAWRSSRDSKITQDLARHESMEMTARYTHLDGELDEKYKEIFNA